MILLDTHIWLWWLLGNSRLSDLERQTLDVLAAQRRVAISIMSVWEAELLERRKRVVFDKPVEEWFRQATNANVVSVLPIDLEIILMLRTLPDSLPNDPGDRLITGTAKVHGIPLATHDRIIIASKAVTIWTPTI